MVLDVVKALVVVLVLGVVDFEVVGVVLDVVK